MIDTSQLVTQLITRLTMFDGTPVKFKVSYRNNEDSEFINIFVTDETSEFIDRSNVGEIRFNMYKNIISGLPALYIISMGCNIVCEWIMVNAQWLFAC